MKKKLLLLALVAFIGISAQAQNKPKVITEQPAGAVKVYKRVSGKMFYKSQGKLNELDYSTLLQNDQGPGDLRVITGSDGKTVYLKYVLSYASYIKDDQAGGWVKGTKKGNKITIPAGQYIMYGKFDDGEYGLCVGYLEYKNGGFEVSNEPITFTLEGATAKLDGTYIQGEISNISRLKLLGAYWSDDKSFFCGDVATVCSTNQTGIGTIEKDDNKQVVGETYFDLSGRKLSEPGKGLIIKNIRFADGTTKTVKYINK